MLVVSLGLDFEVATLVEDVGGSGIPLEAVRRKGLNRENRLTEDGL